MSGGPCYKSPREAWQSHTLTENRTNPVLLWSLRLAPDYLSLPAEFRWDHRHTFVPSAASILSRQEALSRVNNNVLGVQWKRLAVDVGEGGGPAHSFNLCQLSRCHVTVLHTVGIFQFNLQTSFLRVDHVRLPLCCPLLSATKGECVTQSQKGETADMCVMPLFRVDSY